MVFKKMTVADAPLIKSFHCNNREYSCETDFVNLLVWQEAYGNSYAIEGKHLIIKTTTPDEGDVFRLPLGDDLKEGIELICEYAGTDHPVFWVQEGPRLDEFRVHYGDQYDLIENRDAFDYIYETADLAELSGKKYHSKRNHISAFTKKYDWHYERITSQNLEAVRKCAKKWYAQNNDRMDLYMYTEQCGVMMMLSGLDALELTGGAVFVNDAVVAFTLGSAIGPEIFDVHIEKALPDYAEAYTVINREFVKNELSAYRYVNREDDLGLEGLRKAKLSYHPAILLKKYYCRPR